MPLLDPLTSVAQSLRDNKIIPDAFPDDDSFRISTLFSVTWGRSEVVLGNEVNVDDVQFEPKVQITPMGTFDESANATSEIPSVVTHTVALVDLDAPSREDRRFSPFRHWLISGLMSPTVNEIMSAASTTKDLLDPEIDPLSAMTSSSAVTPYLPPSPEEGTGVHRYAFLLFQEPSGGITREELGDRSKWSAVEFARKNGLHLVGANFFKIRSKAAVDK